MTTTIDMRAISAKHTSTESATRTRRRRWAQTRLKAYGIIAILLAAAALVILLWTIVVKTVTVLNESYLAIETQIEVSDSDMERLRDPNPRVRASLNGVVRDAMLAEIGGEQALNDRSEARALFNLLSTDAGLELGGVVKESILNNESIVGETYLFDALLDDQVQMYLNGEFGRLIDAGSEGALEITRFDPETDIEAPGSREPLIDADRAAEVDPESAVVLRLAPQALSEARSRLREVRAEQARGARRLASRQDAGVAAMEDEIAAAREAGEPTESLEARRDNYADQRDQYAAQADALLRKATTPGAVYTLTEDDPSILVRANSGWIKVTRLTQERALGTIVEQPTDLATAEAGSWTAYLMTRAEANRNISDRQVIWLTDFEREGKIVERFNWRLLASSDSSNAELAGIWGALVGSFWTMVVTFGLAFPVGVMASIYLEEFAPKNAFTDFIEININNLAAVPSIVFGLLGITVLISGVSLFGVDLFDGLLKSITEDPRSTPLAGGVVLALMSLPTIIIAGRASIKAVPPSIREAALGVGASTLQTSTHHVLPLAMPGILTGSIIAMAQALGETAPLIIIGMNSFIQEAPSTPVDKGNVLPSLIYLWNANSERLFDGKTAAAISVLLLFLIAMNALAVLLRKRFERRW